MEGTLSGLPDGDGLTPNLPIPPPRIPSDSMVLKYMQTFQ